MNKKLLRYGIVAVIAVLVSLFFYFDLGSYLTLDYLKGKQAEFQAFYQAHVWQTLGAYLLFYIVATALSLPGATLLTVAAGALFGMVAGTVLVSFASTIGATLAFLAARFVVGGYVQERFKDRLETINKGVDKDGAFYLFTLRLIPIIPFFVINLVMGLTRIRTVIYFFVSQLGMFPATLVYVYAGTQLANINKLSDIVSFQLLLAFALIGLFPLFAKKLVEFLRSRRTEYGDEQEEPVS